MPGYKKTLIPRRSPSPKIACLLAFENQRDILSIRQTPCRAIISPTSSTRCPEPVDPCRAVAVQVLLAQRMSACTVTTPTSPKSSFTDLMGLVNPISWTEGCLLLVYSLTSTGRMKV